MADGIFTVLGLGTLGELSIMAFLTMLVVETLKQVVPKKVPTALLTLIVALIIAIVIPLIAPGVTVTIASVLTSILNGFVTAFISMNGFDSLKQLWTRMKGTGIDNVDEGEGQGGDE